MAGWVVFVETKDQQGLINKRFSHLFPLKKGPLTKGKKKYIEPTWKSIRYGFSFLPFSIRLMNGEGDMCE